VDLRFRTYGEIGRRELVVLHGLLGSSRNWKAAGEQLGERYRVYCLDLRNHGGSPWASPHSYEAMIEDVLSWMDEHCEAPPALIGHSMGGKLAMKLACDFPKALEKLVVVDIQPRRYANTHDDDFAAMRAVDLRLLKGRSDAERQMEPHVASWKMRKFLLTNLERDPASGRFHWKVNLDAIAAGRSEIAGSPLEQGDAFGGETLFVMGGQSRFYAPEEWEAVERRFPKHRLEVIEESGHNPHFEQRERFVGIVEGFLG